MKNSLRRKLSTVLMIVFAAAAVQAQSVACPDIASLDGSLLKWFLGRQVVQGKGDGSHGARLTMLLAQGKNDEAKKLLSTLSSDSNQVSGLGVFLLASGDISGSVSAFSADTLQDSVCRYPELAMAARYLQKYGTQAPLFPGFNGGFYHFLKDSLYGGEKLSLDRYDKALHALDLWFRLSGGKSPVALELFGDLLYRHPNRFIGNFFGALAYMRAANLSKGEAEKVFLEKSIFAMEAPAEVSKRFDRYRFTQLHKSFLADVEGKSEATTTDPTTKVEEGGILFMDTQDAGDLAGFLTRAHKRHTENTLNKVAVTDQVDARKVKQETTFNVYALFMISAVIGAVVFFWVRLKKASKEK